MADVPTPAELRDLLAAVLEGAVGGSAASWRESIGPVTKRPLHENIRSNWSIAPSGAAEDLATILKAAEIIRGAHPYITG